MKKTVLIALFALLCLLCACGSVREPYGVTIRGQEFWIDPETQTISFGADVYRYAFSGRTTTVTYPNGAQYVYEQNVNGLGGSGSWGDAYDETRYVSGGTLVEVLAAEMPGEKGGGDLWFPALLLIALGLWNLLAPRSVWYLSHGMWYQNAEPSAVGLTLIRVGGGVAAAAGAVIFLAPLFR